MKYGIIGASGTLGQVTVRQLLAESSETAVNALVRRPDEGLDALERCSTYVGGIFDPEQLDRFIADSDLIVNLAARNPEGEALDRQNHRDFFLVNAAGAATVAAAAARQKKPLLHFSTVSVYETGAVEADHLFAEDDVLPNGDSSLRAWSAALTAALASSVARDAEGAGELIEAMNDFLKVEPLPAAAPVYGLSKLVGETLALDIADAALAVRMCDVYGPGHESRGVVVDHLQALADGGPMTVDFGAREGVYFLYIDDVSRLIAAVAARHDEIGEMPRIVNFVGERVAEPEFAGFLRELRGNVDIGLRDAAERSKAIDRRYGRAEFERTFGHFKFTSLADGLSKTSAAYLE